MHHNIHRRQVHNMKLSSNIIKFHDELGLYKTLDIFAEAGFEGIDFNADLEEYCNDTHDEAFYKSAKEYALEKGLTIVQAHSPLASSFSDEERNKLRNQETIKSIKHSAWLGAEMIVIHPCKHIDYRDNNYDLMMEYNLNFYKKLIPYAEEYNIRIAIENIGKSITETPEGLLELVDLLDNDIFTICGLSNVAKDIVGWNYSTEALLNADPDYIFIRKEDIKQFCQTEPYTYLKAVKNGNVIPIESAYIDLQVPRNIDGLLYIYNTTHNADK